MKSPASIDEVLARISTVATGVFDSILAVLSGRPSIAQRRRLCEEHQKTLSDCRAKGDEMLARLRDSTEQIVAKHEQNLERHRKTRASVDKSRLELADSDLPADEVRRRLLVMESTLKTVEDQIEAEAERVSEARERERRAIAALSRTHSRWERFVERERAGLEKDGSVFGVVHRIWEIVSFVLVYFLVTNRISGRRKDRD